MKYKRWPETCAARSALWMTILIMAFGGLWAQKVQENGEGGSAPSLERSNMGDATGFYCNTRALTKTERQNYKELTGKLAQARLETKELSDGYAFRLKSGMVRLSDLATWISYERRCCPFFSFEIEVERERGPLWLKLRGKEGVKPFIRAEFSVQ